MLPIRDLNPAQTSPVITICIIILCVVVFIYQLGLGIGKNPLAGQTFAYRYGLVPFEISKGVQLIPSLSDVARGFPWPRPEGASPYSLIAKPVSGPGEAIRLLYLPILYSMFLHGGIGHLLFNMLFLWIFGNNVEDAMGHFRFLVFYVACGLAAAAVHIMTNLYSQLPTVGASGAIAGVMGAYIVLFPRARILTLVMFFFSMSFIELPAVIFLGIWFITQLLMAGGGGEVAWFAHIGGFIAGLLLVKRFVRYSPRSRMRRRWE